MWAALMFTTEFADPEVTETDIKNVQFYLGPAHSGAPMHFHRC